MNIYSIHSQVPFLTNETACAPTIFSTAFPNSRGDTRSMVFLLCSTLRSSSSSLPSANGFILEVSLLAPQFVIASSRRSVHGTQCTATHPPGTHPIRRLSRYSNILHQFVRRLPRSVPGTPLVFITDPGHVSIHRADEPSHDPMHTLLQRCTGSVQVLLSRLSVSIPNSHGLHLVRTAPVTLFCPGFYTLDLHFVIKFYHRSEE